MAKKDCLIWIEEKEARVTHFGTTILELNLDTKEIYYIGGYSQTDSKYMNDLLQKWKFFKVGENEGFFTVHRRSKKSNDYNPSIELWKRTNERKDERIIIKEGKRMIILSPITHISFLEYMKN